MIICAARKRKKVKPCKIWLFKLKRLQKSGAADHTKQGSENAEGVGLKLKRVTF